MRVHQSARQDCKALYTVSAEVRTADDVQEENKRTMPLFGCPRECSETSAIGEVNYVQERFKETDLLPVFVVAIEASSVQNALDIIFGAHQPQNSALRAETGRAFNQRIIFT